MKLKALVRWRVGKNVVQSSSGMVFLRFLTWKIFVIFQVVAEERVHSFTSR